MHSQYTIIIYYFKFHFSYFFTKITTFNIKVTKYQIFNTNYLRTQLTTNQTMLKLGPHPEDQFVETDKHTQ